MGCYQKIFQEYAYPMLHWKKNSKEFSDKYFNHVKNDSATKDILHARNQHNIHRAHIQNRKLDVNLMSRVSALTKLHGMNCGLIERQQTELYKRKSTREGMDRTRTTSSYYPRGTLVEKSQMKTSRGKMNFRPFSVASDFMIHRHKYNNIKTFSNNLAAPHSETYQDVQQVELLKRCYNKSERGATKIVINKKIE